MFDESGLMEPFSAAHMPENLHITCYLPMKEGSAGIHCCLCIFHDVLLTEDGIKYYFSCYLVTERRYGNKTAWRGVSWWVHDMEWIKPRCRNAYILCGIFPCMLGRLLHGYAWLHRWQPGLAVKVRQSCNAVLIEIPSYVRRRRWSCKKACNYWGR